LSDMAARAFVIGNDAKMPKFPTPESAEIGSQNSLLRRYVGGGKGPLPEEISEIAVRELFKVKHIAGIMSLLADWRRVDPSSETLNALLTELRSKPSARGLIIGENFALLGRLFGGQPLRNLEGPRSLARAKRLSTFYLTHYYHAVPFDRGVLRAAWGNCSVQGCGRVRDHIEKQLGKIDAPRRGDFLRRGSGAGSPVPEEATDSTDRSDSPASS
jgi:hypothetical protein